MEIGIFSQVREHRVDSMVRSFTAHTLDHKYEHPSMVHAFLTRATGAGLEIGSMDEEWCFGSCSKGHWLSAVRFLFLRLHSKGWGKPANALAL